MCELRLRCMSDETTGDGLIRHGNHVESYPIHGVRRAHAVGDVMVGGAGVVLVGAERQNALRCIGEYALVG